MIAIPNCPFCGTSTKEIAIAKGAIGSYECANKHLIDIYENEDGEIYFRCILSPDWKVKIKETKNDSTNPT